MTQRRRSAQAVCSPGERWDFEIFDRNWLRFWTVKQLPCHLRRRRCIRSIIPGGARLSVWRKLINPGGVFCGPEGPVFRTSRFLPLPDAMEKPSEVTEGPFFRELPSFSSPVERPSPFRRGACATGTLLVFCSVFTARIVSSYGKWRMMISIKTCRPLAAGFLSARRPESVRPKFTTYPMLTYLLRRLPIIISR